MAKGKYHKFLTAEGQTLLQGWARAGLSDLQIAHNIGISSKTYYEWMKTHSKIREAIKKGKEVSDFEVENALYKRALGYEVEETKTYMKDNGTGTQTKHVERTKKHVAGDTTAMIFWLKNRKRDEWSDKHDVQLSGNIDIKQKSDIINKYLNGDNDD